MTDETLNTIATFLCQSFASNQIILSAFLLLLLLFLLIRHMGCSDLELSLKNMTSDG
jgi:hypothetical protein